MVYTGRGMQSFLIKGFFFRHLWLWLGIKLFIVLVLQRLSFLSPLFNRFDGRASSYLLIHILLHFLKMMFKLKGGECSHFPPFLDSILLHHLFNSSLFVSVLFRTKKYISKVTTKVSSKILICYSF